MCACEHNATIFSKTHPCTLATDTCGTHSLQKEVCALHGRHIIDSLFRFIHQKELLHETYRHCVCRRRKPWIW